jgi:hypothetical protein
MEVHSEALTMQTVLVLTRTEHRGIELDEHMVGVFVSTSAIECWLNDNHGNLVEWNDMDKAYWVTNSTVRYYTTRWDVIT